MIAADLQELVDDLAELIGRPISVEDRRWRLIAHSAHEGETDAVRQASILARHAPPDVAVWLDSLELHRAPAAVDVPEQPGFGMAARRAVPLRHGDVFLGVLWVIVGAEALSAADGLALQRTAELAQEVLWQRRTAVDAGRAAIARLLSEVIGGAPADELAAALHWPEPARLVVAVVDTDEDGAERLRRHWPAGDLVWVAQAPSIVVLARLAPGAPPRGVLDAARAQGARAAGASAPITTVREAPRGVRQARVAQLAGSALGRPFAETEELGAWATVADLWDAAGRPAPDPRVVAVRDWGLLESLEAVLDSAGDLTAAAAGLAVHRATLYRRLERIREITGLDPLSGDDRLQLHLGARILRLQPPA